MYSSTLSLFLFNTHTQAHCADQLFVHRHPQTTVDHSHQIYQLTWTGGLTFCTPPTVHVHCCQAHKLTHHWITFLSKSVSEFVWVKGVDQHSSTWRIWFWLMILSHTSIVPPQQISPLTFQFHTERWWLSDENMLHVGLRAGLQREHNIRPNIWCMTSVHEPTVDEAIDCLWQGVTKSMDSGARGSWLHVHLCMCVSTQEHWLCENLLCSRRNFLGKVTGFKIGEDTANQ